MRGFTRAFWLAALLGLLAAGVAGSALAQGPTPGAPTVPGELPPVVCTIGQPCNLGGLVVTVHSATTTDSVTGLAAPQAGFTYLVLDVSIDALTQDQVPYSPNYFVVRTASGYQASFIPLQQIDGLGNGMFWVGSSLRTNVAFPIPVDSRDLVAVYRPLLPGVGFAEMAISLGR